LGQAVATSLLGIQGRAVPHFFRNNLGNLELLLGTETGNVMHYGEITLNEDFTLNTSTYLNVFEGYRSAPYMADLNGNDQLDFLIGNMAGGLGIYYDTFAQIADATIEQLLLVYPNPNNGRFIIDGTSLTGSNTWHLVDAMGRSVANGRLNQTRQEVEIPDLSRGLYILTLSDGRHVKVIISQ
jgi:Secretion system C-terminal sorting domain